jgi:hypothetical protein
MEIESGELRRAQAELAFYKDAADMYVHGDDIPLIEEYVAEEMAKAIDRGDFD